MKRAAGHCVLVKPVFTSFVISTSSGATALGIDLGMGARRRTRHISQFIFVKDNLLLNIQSSIPRCDTATDIFGPSRVAAGGTDKVGKRRKRDIGLVLRDGGIRGSGCDTPVVAT